MNKAVSKGMEILVALAKSKDRPAGNVIADQVGMPLGTVMSHLATLEKRGYVQFLLGGWELTMRPALIWVKASIGRFNLPDAKTYRTIDAVEKAIEILEFVSLSREPRKISEISKVLNIEIGTVKGILESLVEVGFLMQVAEYYRSGMGLSLLWARVKSNLESRLDQLNRDIKTLTIQEAA